MGFLLSAPQAPGLTSASSACTWRMDLGCPMRGDSRGNSQDRSHLCRDLHSPHNPVAQTCTLLREKVLFLAVATAVEQLGKASGDGGGQLAAWGLQHLLEPCKRDRQAPLTERMVRKFPWKTLALPPPPLPCPSSVPPTLTRSTKLLWEPAKLSLSALREAGIMPETC